MIITCPNCATDYSVDADVFPVTGRTVKCARCAQTWYALPADDIAADGDTASTVAEEAAEVAADDAGDGIDSGFETDFAPISGEDAPAAADDSGDLDWNEAAEASGVANLPAEIESEIPEIDAEEFDDADEEAVMSAEEVFGPTGGSDAFAGDDGEFPGEDDGDEAAGATIVDDGDEAETAGLAGDMQLPQEDDAVSPGGGVPGVVSIEAASRARRAAGRLRQGLKRKGPVPAALRIKAMAVGGMLAAVVAGIIYREDVVRTLPSMAGLYALAGFEINLRGLAFEDLEPMQEVDRGIPVLRVKGGIRNVAGGAVRVPPVRLSLTSADGQEIYFWTIQPESEALGPGEKTSFSSVLSAPPRAATGIAARFVDPEGVRVGLNRQ